MASPVDTSVKHFLSTMAGAPVLSGTVGSGIAWLDALLVNGFDTKTLSSLTVAGGVATAAFSGSHSAILDSVIAVAGVSGGPSGFAGLNGEQKVTGRPTANTLTFATAVADGTYTGTITIKMAPLGFTKPFSKTNVAVYKSSDPMSNGMYLRVDDSAAQVMRVVGYEAMTDVDTGTGPFPSVAMIAGGGYWHKSSLANATPVAWAFFGDSRVFYQAIQVYTSTAADRNMSKLLGFGDPIALRLSGDVFSTFLSPSYNSAVLTVDACLGNNVLAQHASPRPYTGLGSSVLQNSQHWGIGVLAAAYSGVTPVHGAFPSPIDGGMYLSRRYLAPASTGLPRAELPGLYSVLHSGLFGTFKNGDRVPGTGIVNGRTLVAVTCIGSTTDASSTSNASNTGIVFMDVTGPWR